MINSTDAKKRLDRVNEKLKDMEKALAQHQAAYDRKSLRHAEQVAQHLGKKKQPKALMVQEKSLDTLRNKIGALERGILLYRDKQEDAQKVVRLVALHENHAGAFLNAEQKFTGTAEDLAIALAELKQRIDSFNELVDEFFPIANAPLEQLGPLLAGLVEGISREIFIREGYIEEGKDHEKFLQEFGSRYTETADILPVLEEELLAQLAHSCQALLDWSVWAKRANWQDVVSRSLDFVIKKRQTLDAPPVKAGISSQVVRVPLRPEVSNDHKERLEEIAKHRKMMAVRTVNANKTVNE